MHRLRDECRGHPFAETLLNATGPRAGAFVFPFGHIAVLSNITRAQLNDPARAGLAAVFSQGNVVTRDDLVAWGDLDAAALKAELARRFDPFWSIPRMAQQQVDVLRSVIHPEVTLSAVKQPSRTDAPVAADLKVLDYRQERNARSIGDSHRIIYGVAGSGKTVLLIARAKNVGGRPGEPHPRSLLQQGPGELPEGHTFGDAECGGLSFSCLGRQERGQVQTRRRA